MVCAVTVDSPRELNSRSLASRPNGMRMTSQPHSQEWSNTFALNSALLHECIRIKFRLNF